MGNIDVDPIGKIKKNNSIDKMNDTLKFLLICIPLRITLGLFLWFFLEDYKGAQEDATSTKLEKFQTAIIWTVIVIGFLSLLVLSILSTGNYVWWSRPFEMVVAGVMIGLSFAVLKGGVDGKYLAVPMWIDVGIGLMLFLWKTFYGL